ncbi:MAG: DUF892 family protein [Cyclobacteriaceae bacterium]
MNRIKDLHDLFIEQLRDLYNGETLIKEAFGETFERATNKDLKQVLTSYKSEQEEQRIRLQQVFEIIFYQKRGEKNQIIMSMLEDTKRLSDRCDDMHTRDAALITTLQHIIHYKIAAYGALSTYARRLEHYDAGEILHHNLTIEKEIDRKLVVIAESSVNSESLSSLE